MDQFRPSGAAVPFPAPRRHSTVPTSFQPAPPRAAPEPTTDHSVETLYNHPSVRIVAFTAGKSAFERTRPSADDKPGTLPSSSQFERLIAVGAFQIYRAPGSVAFLRSGSALQPILPKSQAWSLDEKSSKFVLQIRRPNYWRIEVPVGNDEEIRRALLLREVLDKILQFEKTPCPFERSFTVELPEIPKTPIKKRTWTPPTRTVSMNWPPGQPITPPPEFPSRTRFYNPGARRASDFGVDTSRFGLTSTTSPQRTAEPIEEDAEKAETPSKKTSLVESAMIRKPLAEEPDPLSPPLTAVHLGIAQVTEGPTSQNLAMSSPSQVARPTEPTVASAASETQVIEAPVRKREPIWITKKVPSSANRKAKRAAVAKTQAADPMVSTAKQPADSTLTFRKEGSKKSASEESEAKQTTTESPKCDAQKDASEELEAAGGSLEGSGQLRVRRTRLAAFASRRAATAPPLRLRTSSASSHSSVQERTPTPEPGSPAESLDSFHSVQSWHSPLSPPAPSPIFSPTKATYPYPHENIPLAPLSAEQTAGVVTTPTVSGWDRNSIGAVAGSGAQTPNTPFSDVQDEKRDQAAEAAVAFEASGKGIEDAAFAIPITSKQLAADMAATSTDTDSLATSWSSAASHTSCHSNTPMRHRAATTSVAISHRSPRALSPLPPAANLLTTDLTSRTTSAARAIRRIPSSIFNRTCEILISPPAHLISLMLKVAERITAGEWQGLVFGMDESGEVVDVRWDYGDVDGSVPGGWEGSDLDFGRHSSSARRHRNPDRKSRASFAGADLSRPEGVRRKVAEYQDPWATPPEEPDMDEEGHWSLNWGVD